MGMSNMQVQQPMQQGSGKGGVASQFSGGGIRSNTPSYFDANPDVAQSYQQNSYGMTPEQFSQTHYQKYGQAEGRANPGQQPRIGQPNPYSNTVRPWDNASIMPQQQIGGAGKAGKSGGQAQPGGYPVARTNFSYTAPVQQTIPASQSLPARTSVDYSGY